MSSLSTYTFNHSTWEVRQACILWVWREPGLHNELQYSQGYVVSPFLKTRSPLFPPPGRFQSYRPILGHLIKEFSFSSPYWCFTDLHSKLCHLFIPVLFSFLHWVKRSSTVFSFSSSFSHSSPFPFHLFKFNFVYSCTLSYFIHFVIFLWLLVV